jgi:hypothetical protein
MIEVLFTRSNLPGSRWIRELTGEPVSHCAIHWMDKVIHSSYYGVKKVEYTEFAAHNEIVYRVSLPIPSSVILDIWIKYHDKPYDYGALLFLGARYLLSKIGIKTANHNLWQDSGCFICTEFVSSAIIGKTDSTITPYQLYLELDKSRENI